MPANKGSNGIIIYEIQLFATIAIWSYVLKLKEFESSKCKYVLACCCRQIESSKCIVMTFVLQPLVWCHCCDVVRSVHKIYKCSFVIQVYSGYIITNDKVILTSIAFPLSRNCGSCGLMSWCDTYLRMNSWLNFLEQGPEMLEIQNCRM